MLPVVSQVSMLAVNLIGTSLQDMSPGRNVSVSMLDIMYQGSQYFLAQSNQDTLGTINRSVEYTNLGNVTALYNLLCSPYLTSHVVEYACSNCNKIWVLLSFLICMLSCV